ncbi:apical membrane antigen 1, putative [Plasmodium relictum]|uniref:Apical membrane antigen 1, putative n=2 Tax=Plasmodium relictum TaxID=85471 RepID=A0A1J1H9C9_PLARL|nr:apical membrane antigen 1, putative [Plasmodium relictum]CRH00206.1 apical membrane antigen 1, putative [Plasmodium relictum]
MRKLYYILILSAQHFIYLSKCGKLTKKGANPQDNLLDNGKAVERSQTIQNPWREYMKKYDIQNNHASGIRVDLGGDAEFKDKTYRLPIGKCPVFGKGITIENSNKSFLDSVAVGNEKVKSGGFAFPKFPNGEHISPLSLEVLRVQYNHIDELKNLNPISLCSKHASNIRPDGDLNSEYRYPSVYDIENNICYVLYISAQENMGPRYCDSNKNNENALFCFKPEKLEKYKNLVYLTRDLRDDWEEYCPRKSLGNSKFGLWVDGICEEIPLTHSYDADNIMKCNELVFQSSACDQPRIYEEEFSDYEKLSQGIKNGNVNAIRNVFFPKGAFESDRYKSNGKGYNWANYDTVNKKCYIFNVKPTCLINDKNYIATTALSHPTEMENNFPCEIYKEAIEKEIGIQSKKMELQSNEKLILPRIFISNDKESLKCPCTPEEVVNSTCRFFVCRCIERMEELTKNNETKLKDEYVTSDPSSGNKKTMFIIATIVALVLLAAAFLIYFYRKKKSDDKFEKMEQTDAYGKSNERKDELLDPEASFWGEEKRGSHTTPVLMEKPYY